MILNGKSICPGIASGPAHVADNRAILAAALKVEAEGPPEREMERLQAGIARATVELERVQRQVAARLQATDVAIFESHAGLLRDPQFLQRVELEIRTGLSAEASVARVAGDIHASFLAHPVSLVQDKATDILDIGRRLVRCLSPSHESETDPESGSIVVAASLTPSQLVRYAHLGIVAAVTEACGTNSHTAILARGLRIPFVTGLPAVFELIPHGVPMVVDAAAGRVIYSPTKEEEQACALLRDRHTAEVAEEEAPPALPITLDGVRIRLLLNISDAIEAEAVPLLGADGVGLFRTEFPYMDRTDWPTAGESYEIYRSVARSLAGESNEAKETVPGINPPSRDGGSELAVRLVDFGAEKCPPYADIPINRNPSLGLRGIRLLLQREDILRPQVEALARLARERPTTVLIPMLDSVDTLDETIGRLCQIVGCTARDELPFRLGAMIEVPSAALLIDDLLPQIDSVSIGLNDLTQYLLAADRDDEFVERYHDPLQPPVLRLVRHVIASCDAAFKPVTICGELAGDPKLTGLLLALGLRRFSVSRSSYRQVVNSITHLEIRSMTGIANEVLRFTTAREVHQFVKDRLTDPRALDLNRSNRVPLGGPHLPG